MTLLRSADEVTEVVLTTCPIWGAHDILQRAASALAALAESVRTSLNLDGPVVLAGGLLLNQPALEAAVREALSLPCVRLEEPPVAGAVNLAEALAARTEDATGTSYTRTR